MKQVLIRDGRVVVEEMPVPVAEPGRVLVRTAWSVLSAGTERAIVKSSADATGITAALDPSRLRRAFEILREEGPAGIAARLRERAAGAPAAAPGYAAGGRVEAVGRGVDDLPPGTRVACAGAGYASHAEWIAVPRHLVVPVPAAVPLRDAAFTTLGAIALQGVRRAGLSIGECAVVLGLGLIGNLAAQILRAAGVRVLGFDLDPDRAARARGPGLEAWGLASRDPLEEVPRASGGLGADAVLVCAAAPGSEAVHLAMRLCRRRGRVVIVGDVGLEIQRSLMYEKELDLVMSTSYGPGRYDPQYEEKGIDYPAAHVRWTENRNMAAFLELLRERRVAVAPLADRILDLQEAAAAYALLDGGGSRPLGILLRYAPEETASAPPLPAPAAAEPAEAAPPGVSAGVPAAIDTVPETRRAIGVGLIGAGAFVRIVHLPCLKRDRSFALAAVATGSPVSARETARRFGIPAARADYREVLADEEVDLVVIGTRHDLHAAPAREALAAGKHVFVEKPLCLEEAELDPILEEARRRRRLLAVGFNRRYSLLSRRLREALDRLEGPALAIYRVNAGRLPAGHWALDPATGGGRILGECGHFLDLLLFLLRAPLTEVRAAALPSDGIRVVGSDSFAATLGFADGSRAVLAYTGLGDPGLPKERLELFKQGAAMVLDDFRSLRVHGAPGGSFEPGRQDKGFEAQWRAIAAALRGAPSDVITLPEIEAATRATFRLDRAVRGERWTS
jgi:predicted dehydrogenase/threonine dehydrogenase-like Zn-dependent dehydrogenase